MSPEQASGGRLDGRSDIFSYGALVYEMATGRRAFTADGVPATLAAVLKDEPPSIRALASTVPEGLETVVRRCLRKDPARRFQDMRDVRVELVEVAEQLAHAATVTTTPRRFGRRGVALAASLGLVALAGLWWRVRPAAPPPATIVQIASERWAGSGSFSPDGTQIAYASAGDDGKNWDIRLRIIGESESRRLTSDPEAEDLPAWAPGGTQIAFLRYRGRTFRGLPGYSVGEIQLVSPLGGPSRRLTPLPVSGRPSWSPDGRWLAAAKARGATDAAGGVYVVEVATGAAHAVTAPAPTTFHRSPAFSPDGQELAYASCVGLEGSGLCDVRVVALDADARPVGAARRLPGPLMADAGLAWSRDGRWLIVSGGALWRVRSDGRSAPELFGVGPGTAPATATGRDRLAFVRGGNADIYELRAGGSPRPLIRSAFSDIQPRYSPDGYRIAFVSARTGTQEIWLADADGANPFRLTRGPGNQQGYPGWSPDGRILVFDSRADDGHADVWTIDASGSGLRRITSHPADDTVPSFSRDGRFIYFTSNRTGRHEIWRVPAAGGAEEQMTRDGGAFPLESRDGRILYYKSGSSADDGPLGELPSQAGMRALLPCVAIFGYDVGPRGVVHHECGVTSPIRPLRLWDAATGSDRLLGTIEADWVGGISVSPDGTRVIYGRGEAASSLMMIDNFR
jgi:Tol biopolymer transport system component